MSPRQDSAQPDQPEAAEEQPTVPGYPLEETAIEVLRAIWDGQGQSRADLEESFGAQRSCKSMQNVGFDGMAGPEGDLRLAWQEKLRREGKLKPQADSIRDLVLGPVRPGTR